MTSSVDICNLALGHVGVRREINTIENGETESEDEDLCARLYPRARDEVLRMHAWPFATKFVALALVAAADAQPWANLWGYVYRYPTDAARLINVLSACRAEAIPIPYDLGQDDRGKIIYTDSSEAAIRYAIRAENPDLWPADFGEAVAWKLAFHLAMPISGRRDLRADADAAFTRALGAAQVSCSAEVKRDPDPDAESVRIRR